MTSSSQLPASQPYASAAGGISAARPGAASACNIVIFQPPELCLYVVKGWRILAKIAVGLERAIQARRISGEPGEATSRTLAQGDGWRVADVICTSGPDDRPFEERHVGVSVAVVVAGPVY